VGKFVPFLLKVGEICLFHPFPFSKLSFPPTYFSRFTHLQISPTCRIHFHPLVFPVSPTCRFHQLVISFSSTYFSRFTHLQISPTCRFCFHPLLFPVSPTCRFYLLALTHLQISPISPTCRFYRLAHVLHYDSDDKYCLCSL